MRSSPFIHNQNSLNRVMWLVVLSLTPALVFWSYQFAWFALVQLFLCLLSCYGFEWIALKLRKKPIKIYLYDGSTAIVALLLFFCIPPIAPWWVSVISCGFAILLGKQLYGGLGHNIFNPAMLGYAIALVSFPTEFSIWLAPSMENTAINHYSLLEVIVMIFQENNFYQQISAATPLAQVREQPLLKSVYVEQLLNSFWFYWNIMIIIGGLLLLQWKIIKKQSILGFFAGLLFVISLLSIWQGNWSTNLFFHLFYGATIIGVFFIITDPVSSATTPKGRIIYGFIIAVMLVLIRELGNFPDGIAFAVLIGNLVVPLLDYYLKKV